MLLMDRLFRRRGLITARIGPLERLAYIGSNAMGAMSFEPVAPEGELSQQHIPLDQLAAEVQEVLQGEDDLLKSRFHESGFDSHGLGGGGGFRGTGAAQYS